MPPQPPIVLDSARKIIRVLVVDDSAVVRQTMKEILESEDRKSVV